MPEVYSYLGGAPSDIASLHSGNDSWQSQSYNNPTVQPYHLVSEASIGAFQVPKHVALLLPLQGSLGASGRAVRNGFLAAYYQAKSAGGQVPKLTILDTSSNDIITLYQQALVKGADFIVGPLSRSNLKKLVYGQKLTVRALALNSGSHYRHRQPYLVQFALSPADEAYQVAEKAWQDGHRYAAIIAPDNVWGRSLAKAFARQWQAVGGRLVAEVSYKNRRSLNADIKSLLNVDRSETREKNLEKVLHQSVHFVPRRRRDIDVIFLAALPNQARQIRPLIKFYYGQGIAIYATSSVYSGIPSSRQDNDLNGVYFCEAPWLLKSPNDLTEPSRSIYQRIVSTWPNQYRHYPKLHLFGADAYRLVGALRYMQERPDAALNGANGALYLSQGRIYRQLSWGVFHQGLAHLMK